MPDGFYSYLFYNRNVKWCNNKTVEEGLEEEIIENSNRSKKRYERRVEEGRKRKKEK